MEIMKDNISIEVTCPSCRSILAVHCHDINIEEIIHHRPGQWVACAVCEATIPIPLTEIPQKWRVKLFHNYD